MLEWLVEPHEGALVDALEMSSRVRSNAHLLTAAQRAELERAAAEQPSAALGAQGEPPDPNIRFQRLSTSLATRFDGPAAR